MTDSAFTPNSSESPAIMLDIQQVADILRCSPRHVQRLADAEKMPRPVRLGNLLRWQKLAIEEWVSAGCPTSESRGAR